MTNRMKKLTVSQTGVFTHCYCYPHSQMLICGLPKVGVNTLKPREVTDSSENREFQVKDKPSLFNSFCLITTDRVMYEHTLEVLSCKRCRLISLHKPIQICSECRLICKLVNTHIKVRREVNSIARFMSSLGCSLNVHVYSNVTSKPTQQCNACKETDIFFLISQLNNIKKIIQFVSFQTLQFLLIK